LSRDIVKTLIQAKNHGCRRSHFFDEIVNNNLGLLLYTAEKWALTRSRKHARQKRDNDATIHLQLDRNFF